MTSKTNVVNQILGAVSSQLTHDILTSLIFKHTNLSQIVNTEVEELLEGILGEVEAGLWEYLEDEELEDNVCVK